jgi:ribose transport system ATP-binding protein
LLKVENITKRFSGVTVLDSVSVELHAGQVNAIIGENGAGKSTLMKILSGVYTEYGGQIIYRNEPVQFTSTKDAQSRGISIIHQELNLIPYLSITENVFLGRELTNAWGGLRSREMQTRTQELLNRLKLDVPPDTQVYKLKVGQQQVVEIAKALLFESEVIIMDEPTSAISDQEVEVLFDIIRDLRKASKAIVYISHKLDELFEIADRYIVLRDGKHIDSGSMREIDHDQLIRKMVGRNIEVVKKKEATGQREELLQVKNLCLKHPSRKNELFLKNISFNLEKGEILGIFGLMGAGRTELLESIFGLHPATSSAEIKVNQRILRLQSPDDAIKAGMALVPEDRKQNGLILGLDVRTNISLTSLKKLERLGWLSESRETVLAGKYIQELSIKTSSDRQLAENLSGGNQQKIVLSKWLATNPSILLLDEPTRGIDVNAKNEIYKLILQLAASGMGILMVSSELPEIMAVSDRILVMAEGSLCAEFDNQGLREDQILKAAIPKTI